VSIQGDFAQAATGTLNIDLGGIAAAKQGAIAISGAAAFDGTLSATFVNGFAPVSGDTFKVLTFSSATGTFATVTSVALPTGLNLTAVYDTSDVTLDVS
jgi:hypothetical protein